MAELHKDHIHFEKVFKILDQQVELLTTDGHPDYYLMADITNYIQQYPDLVHHPKEDKVYDVFTQRSNEAADIVEQLQQDHQKLPSKTIELHKLFEAAANSVVLISREEIKKEAQDFLEMQKKHLNLEETILFPLIIKTLTEDDWKSLESSIAMEISDKVDPLFGATIAECCENLYQSIKKQGDVDSK